MEVVWIVKRADGAIMACAFESKKDAESYKDGLRKRYNDKGYYIESLLFFKEEK